MTSDLRVSLSGIPMKNPLTTASGTFDAKRHSQFFDLSVLGAVTVKGVSKEPWQGNQTPRIAEVYGGALNSVGLQNPGAKVFLEEDLPFLKQFDTKVFVNLAGHSIEEYEAVAEALKEAPVDLFELNISCPNIAEGGAIFGSDPKVTEEVVSRVRRILKKPLFIKLTPNVTDVTEIARACEAAGADGLTLINTLLGMRIDVHSRRPILANKVGGFSGPAIKPVAVRIIYQVHRAVKLPIIGIGGVMSGEDVAELMLAGATSVGLGTVNLVEPSAPVRVLRELSEYLDKEGVSNVSELIGAAL